MAVIIVSSLLNRLVPSWMHSFGHLLLWVDSLHTVSDHISIFMLVALHLWLRTRDSDRELSNGGQHIQVLDPAPLLPHPHTAPSPTQARTSTPIYSHLLKLLFDAPVELRCLHRDVPPDDSHHGACDCHPHHRNGRRNPRLERPEVELRQQEAEGRRLHGGLNGHRARWHFRKSHPPGKLFGVIDDSGHDVNKSRGRGRRGAGVLNAIIMTLLATFPREGSVGRGERGYSNFGCSHV